MKLKYKNPVVFAFWKDGELIGFRAGTMGHISETHPKIYEYSKEQVDIVMNNVKSSLNRSWSKFIDALSKKGNVSISTRSPHQEIDADKMGDHIKKTEDKVRSLGTFEVRVHPFIGYGEDFTYPEPWELEEEIANLKPAIEVKKFVTIQNEN